MKRDLSSNVKVMPAIPPQNQTGNTALVSSIIDTQGFSSLMFAIASGSLADAGATFTVLVEDGDVDTLTDSAAVSDSELIGTEALASFTQAEDNGAFKIGYKGNKRYVRLTITPAGNAADAYISAVAILGADQLPQDDQSN